MSGSASGQPPLRLDGTSLEIDEVVAVARFRRRVALTDGCRRRMARSRVMVEVLLERGEKVYGLTTGFGKLRDVAIPIEATAELQKNLIMSHSCGVGRPYPEDVVRAAMLLRVNTLCRGHSGIRVEVVEQLVRMLNDDCYPYVPEKGSVGASGDLAPLSHLALTLIGHPASRYYPRSARRDPDAIVYQPAEVDFQPMPQGEAFERARREEGWTFEPVVLEAKEGLALNNGTQFMTASGALAADDARRALRFAELAGAASLEAQRGVRNAYDERLHRVRPHAHQLEVARRVMAYCEDSQILDLYLNSAHLNRAAIHLREVLRLLDGDGVKELENETARSLVARVRAGAKGLLGEIDRTIPVDDGGKVDEEKVRERAALPPREQIKHFTEFIGPLRRRAIGLLRNVENDDLARLAASEPIRSALVAAVDQLNETVPEAPLVQDDYSFRCFPQVLACGYRALEHVCDVLRVEINSANDNPLLFPPGTDDEAQEMDGEAYRRWLGADPARIERCLDGVLGGGNFHGEPIAIAMDYLAIAMAEVANIAERRIAHLVDENLSRGLPAFLIESGGLNSGFMIPQYTAAALVSENKVLCHPASVDSIPTCANSEDHVSMGTHAARKAAEVIDNVLDVIGIELLAAYQGLKFREPLQPGKPLRKVIDVLAREGIERWTEDRVFHPDFRRIRQLMIEPALLDCLLPR